MDAFLDNWDRYEPLAVLVLLLALPLVPTLIIYALLNTESMAQFIQKRNIGAKGQAMIRLGGPVAFYFIMFSSAFAAYTNLTVNQYKQKRIADALHAYNITPDQLATILSSYKELDDTLNKFSVAVDKVEDILASYETRRSLLVRVAGAYCYTAHYRWDDKPFVAKGAMRFRINEVNEVEMAGFDKQGNDFTAAGVSVGYDEMYYRWQVFGSASPTQGYFGVTRLRFSPSQEDNIQEMRGEWYGAIAGKVELTRVPDEGHCTFQAPTPEQADQ